MAKGDVRVEVRADGWSADLYVEDYAVGSTIDYGFSVESITVASGTANRPTPTDATPYILATDLGFDSGGDATTVERKIYIVGKVRKPFPDQADIDEEVVTGEWRCRVILSEECYAKANTGAGNSGTAIALFAPAGAITNSADSHESNLANGVAGVNDSTLAYPKVIGQWAHDCTPAYLERVASTFEVGFRPRHGIRGIAAVRFNATGADSSESLEAVVSTRTKKQSPLTGLYHDPFAHTFSTSVFDQGENLILRARAYPRIGDADSVLDTDDRTTIIATQRGDARTLAVCDRTEADTVFAVVSTTGNDGTGATSSTESGAASTPYLTWDAAANSGANMICFEAGTYDMSDRLINNASAFVFRPRTGVDKADVVLRVNTGTTNLRRIRIKHTVFQGLRFDQNSAIWNAVSQDDGRTCLMRGVDMVGSPPGTGPSMYRFAALHFSNCTLVDFKIGQFSTNWGTCSITGCRIGTIPGNIDTWACVVACDMTATKQTLRFNEITSGSPATDLSTNLMFEFNRFDYIQISSGRFMDVGVRVSGGISIVGNILVWTDDTGAPMIDLWADSNTNPCSNVILSHNTYPGNTRARVNYCYNDSGSSPVLRSRIFTRANALAQLPVKADLFTHPTDGQNGARVGNWAVVFGANSTYNAIDNPLFAQEFMGIGSVNLGNSFGDMGYTDDRSVAGTGAGGGNYTPDTGSPLLGVLPKEYALIDFDLYGTDLSEMADIGAVQSDSGPPAEPILTIETFLPVPGIPLPSGSTWSWGTTANQTQVVQAIRITNTGDGTLILNLDTGTTIEAGEFTKSSGDWSDGVELEPDASIQLAVAFNTDALELEPGVYTRLLSIGSNADTSPYIVELRARIPEPFVPVESSSSVAYAWMRITNTISIT